MSAQPAIWEPQPPAAPGPPRATVHRTEAGLVMLIVDASISAAELGTQLALLVPASAALLRVIGDGEVVVLTFQTREEDGPVAGENVSTPH